jgi:hypothetical protein
MIPALLAGGVLTPIGIIVTRMDGKKVMSQWD